MWLEQHCLARAMSCDMEGMPAWTWDACTGMPDYLCGDPISQCQDIPEYLHACCVQSKSDWNPAMAEALAKKSEIYDQLRKCEGPPGCLPESGNYESEKA